MSHDDLSSMRLRPGDLVAEKYQVEQVLGEGGMGVVVAAIHRELGTRVALKVLHAEAAGSGPAVARFRREAQVAATLRSEHVARVTDFGTDPTTGAPFLVMEYLEGQDLAALLDALRAQGHWMPITAACDHLMQACEAIAEAHRAGVIHRDLKPSNLFLTRRLDGSTCIKVLDFGISKQLSPSSFQGAMTSTHQLMGSPMYMAPEQMRSSKQVSEQADVWALGVILYELLTFEPPFDAEEFGELFMKVQTETPRPPRALRSDIPEALEALVLRCLEKDPQQRPAGLSALMTELAPFASASSQRYLASITSAPSFTSTPPAVSPVTTSAPSLGSATFAKAQTFDALQAPTAAAPTPPRRRGRFVAFLFLVLGVVGGGLALRRTSPASFPLLGSVTDATSTAAPDDPPAASSVASAQPAASTSAAPTPTGAAPVETAATPPPTARSSAPAHTAAPAKTTKKTTHPKTTPRKK